MTDLIDDEYSDKSNSVPPFGGAAPAPAAATGKQAQPALDALAAEIRALASSQPALVSEIVAVQTAIAALPHALGSVAQDAAQQQGSRNAEQMTQIKTDIGQVLAAIAAQRPDQTQCKRGRLGWALALLLFAGSASSAALSGVALAFALGVAAPMGGTDGQMSRYVWLTQGETLQRCLKQLHETGRGVQCPIVFMPQK